MRSRNLKPSIFTNELLAVEDPLYTVIFEGLWCAADREGRLEDKPAKIHMAINPGRTFDGTNGALEWLSQNGFIQRYAVGKARYIQVLAFGKHQNPHHKEAPSKIPEPKTSPGQDQGVHQPRHVAARLIPDSGFLNPDSGSRIPESPFTAPQVQHAPESESEIRERVNAIKAIYPKAARQDWITAEKLIRGIVSCGTDWETITAGVSRYAACCAATSRMVQNPGLWFGAIDKPWLQDWDLPQSKAEKLVDSNISASQQWLREQEIADAKH
jgi:hypothetical protein